MAEADNQNIMHRMANLEKQFNKIPHYLVGTKQPVGEDKETGDDNQYVLHRFTN